MSDDETPPQNRRSGEHPVSYDELMREVRALRKENGDQNKDIAAKVEGLRVDLHSGARRFEQHHARLSAVEKWQLAHDEDHREAKIEAREEKLLEQAEAKEAAKSGPHWAVQAALQTAIASLTTGLIAGLIYLLTVAPKGATP
jgi:hypothetical protein